MGLTILIFGMLKVAESELDSMRQSLENNPLSRFVETIENAFSAILVVWHVSI